MSWNPIVNLGFETLSSWLMQYWLVPGTCCIVLFNIIELSTRIKRSLGQYVCVSLCESICPSKRSLLRNLVTYLQGVAYELHFLSRRFSLKVLHLYIGDCQFSKLTNWLKEGFNKSVNFRQSSTSDVSVKGQISSKHGVVTITNWNNIFHDYFIYWHSTGLGLECFVLFSFFSIIFT